MEDQRTNYTCFPFLPRFPPKAPDDATTNASTNYRFAQESNSSAVPAAITQGGSRAPGRAPHWEIIVDYIFFLILCILVVFSWLVAFCKPESPFIQIDSSYSGSALSANVTNNRIRSNLDATFSVTKFVVTGSVLYEEMTASVFHGQERLSNITIQPFEQHNIPTTVVEVSFPNVSITFDEWLGRCGTSYIDIEINGGTLTFLQGGWPTTRDVMKVSCNGIELKACLPAKNLELKPIDCKPVKPIQCRTYVTAMDKRKDRATLIEGCFMAIYFVAAFVYWKCTKTGTCFSVRR